MALSRDIYEPLLRRLVLCRFSNIKQITGSVIAVQPTTDNWERLGSVSVQSGDVTTTYGAALVIDCSGRASSGYRWFKDTPVDTKQSDTPSGYLPYADLALSYDHKLGSATCEFIVPANFLETIGCPIDRSSSNLYVSIPDYKQDGRAIVIALREHNRLQISFGGYDIREKMTTVGDVRTFFSEMVLHEPLPEWVSNLLDEVEEKQYPPSIWTWRVPPSTYIQYHRAAKLPCNFIAIGDSVLTLNPVPGQGCTKACIEAVTLNSLLKSVREVDAIGNIVIPSGFSNKFFRSQLYRTGRLWDSNRASDYGYETVVPVKGDDHSFGKDQREFIHGKLLPMIITDDETSTIFWAVSAFLEAPTEMMFPSFLFKVWWNSTKARLFSS
ncbi:hypothetical protein SERLA73DRAFT_180384 [Serpula lacrymans var. lacrymans S7.3]|uniref:FAD-binding domain-containing protein n=2 Tax=Serpula lacrymans var. lacrymans TaxID=341189 RepID=F8PUH5_SERL3|nr:uncharacterized protein SERLADRAFT_465967 [Serpula lacrymans var. lacrymans S7.9]EGO00010.1 hypothetical protein SERLA73DRAFT_180384 [Serpula lacrymans var. lacrymans S7.3]EGO25587.1 hypothetical protein SERLADRAFT_465967 [Serpula lacrymans var. lacrymans S7.9]